MSENALNKDSYGIPTLSVLLPVLNGAETLGQALDSLLEQQFDDFEILINDGGSTDGTLAVIKEYLRKDHRIKLYEHHVGLGDSLNFLLSKASARYCARMDADDISLPTRFARQIDLLQSNDDVVLVGTQISYFSGSRIIPRTPYSSEHSQILADLERGIFSIAHPSIMFRTEDARAVGGYREVTIGEDLQFFLDLTRRGKLSNIRDIGLLYRYAPGSITSDTTKAEELEKRYAFTLEKWHSNNDDLSFEEFSRRWNNRPTIKKLASWFARKGNTYYYKYIISRDNHPVFSLMFLVVSAICKPKSVTRHLKRRMVG